MKSFDALREKAKKIKGLAFDCDGVFFTGSVFVDQTNGEALKERSFYDGQGISLLRDAGLRIVFITAEESKFMNVVVNKFNNLKSVKDGRWPEVDVYAGAMGKDKASILESWLQEKGILWKECAYMGDDLSDYEVLQKVGLASAPQQAEEIIKKNVDYVTPRCGGRGAIRDLANLILEAKGVDVAGLNRR